MSYFGQKLFDALKHAPSQVWVGLAVGVVAIAVTVGVVRRRAAKLEGATPE